MNFPMNFYDHVKTNTLIGIKGGRTRESFLNIWMVQVNGRVFARSWNKSEKSWFTEFLKVGVGQVKFGEEVLNVAGRKTPPEDEIQHLVNSAYLLKYDQEQNKPYVLGITQPEYKHYTLEILYAPTT